MVNILSVLVFIAASLDSSVGPDRQARLHLTRDIDRDALRNKGVAFIRPVPDTLEWEGRDYPLDDAIPILVSVLRNSSAMPEKRAVAIDQLSVAGPALIGRPEVDQILSLYPSIANPNEQASLIRCLAHSEDPRAFPLLYDLLGAKHVGPLRRLAASGLAHWNVRAGIQTLIELISDRTADTGRDVGTNALVSMKHLNRIKQWSMPLDSLESAAKQTALHDHDAGIMQLERSLAEWFRQN